jgi:hypothetical protein
VTKIDAETIDERIEVLCVFNNAGSEQQYCFPRKIKYKGRTIEFNELGLRHPTTRGNRMVHIFDMSDGLALYRLEFDAERLVWTLISKVMVE